MIAVCYLCTTIHLTNLTRYGLFGQTSVQKQTRQTKNGAEKLAARNYFFFHWVDALPHQRTGGDLGLVKNLFLNTKPFLTKRDPNLIVV